jgi:hypothetical protein
MKAGFEDLGITIDTAPSSIASLRFLSYDHDAFFNMEAKIFDLLYEPVKPVKNKLKSEKSGGNENSDGGQLIKQFNTTCTAENMHDILTTYGFNFHSKKGPRYRFTRPGKDVAAGLSVDYHSDKRTLFSFSSEIEGLDKWKKERGGWSCSPVTALLQYGFNGNWANTFNYIKSNI